MVKLSAVALVENAQEWVWYALSSLHRHVDEVLVFDVGSVDRTLDVLRALDHLADKLVIWEQWRGGGAAALDVARQRGATHVLHSTGREVHFDAGLGFCRDLLELHDGGVGLALGGLALTQVVPGRLVDEAVLGEPVVLVEALSRPGTPPLCLSGLWFYDFGADGAGRVSGALPTHVHVPEVLFDSAGPDNAVLTAWALAGRSSGGLLPQRGNAGVAISQSGGCDGRKVNPVSVRSTTPVT